LLIAALPLRLADFPRLFVVLFVIHRDSGLDRVLSIKYRNSAFAGHLCIYRAALALAWASCSLKPAESQCSMATIE
jgi:hypothetical protein